MGSAAAAGRGEGIGEGSPEPLPKPPPRLESIDMLRGVIIAVMAIDHARAFISRDHPFEFWGAPIPVYDAVLPFFTRLITHFCAPGFFFLMGVGMTLMATGRRRCNPARSAS